ncbi:3-hydroxyacyl-CoA dehydrogenase NAD-binding domain-containing protein [Roseivivax sp. CAU 1761]
MPVLTIRRESGIAVVTLDNPPVNAVSAAVRQALWDAVAELDADEAVRGVVLACAGRTFIAGADVREFGQPPVEPHLPDVVDRIEGAATPWCAAIHGSALGGGFEIAMGCRFRVAAADARVGLPEVNLGIVPGASGTVRTPRLAGLPAAVELVTGGTPWGAERAREAGLLDEVVEGELVAGAVEFLRAALERDLPTPVSERPVAAQPDSFWEAARKAAAKPGHQAPLKALDCLRGAAEDDFRTALARERETFLALRESDEAAALRHVFFAERAVYRPAAIEGVTPRKVARLGVVGGGTMGAGIAAAGLLAGLAVTMVERDAEAASAGRDRVLAILDGAAKRGKLDTGARAAAEAAFTAGADYALMAEADLVVEAVFEEIGVKRAVFAALAEACRADAILATNTSYLDPRAIAEGLPGPERFIGLHFFSPAHVMKLLEIVPVPETAPEVLAAAFALAKRLGKIPVQAGICEGFIGNRILQRYRRDGEALVEAGVAPAEIDAAIKRFGFRMGLFEMQDLAGLDISFAQREAARTAGRDIPETLGDILVRAGRKGQKTQAGWYDYAAGDRRPQPSAAVAELLSGRVAPAREMDPEEIARRLFGGMAEEGAAILEEGIAERASDIDLVEIHGYGFPRWKGGPMFWSGRG